MHRGVVLLSVVYLVLCGCRDERNTTEPTPPALRLMVGAGLRPAVQELIAAFETQTGMAVEPDYGGSGAQVGRVKMGTEADLFMPGDVSYLASVADRLETPVPVTLFVPTIIVAKGNPKGIASLADFLRPDVKVALGNPRSCRIGQLSKPLFNKHGLDWSGIDADTVMLSTTVNELGVWVKTGQADAAVVWSAIAANVADSVDRVDIPVEKNIVSHVSIAVFRSSARKADATRFVEFITGPDGRRILTARGYHPPAATRPADD